ncbi:NAD(P)/FAD-dependent oxidoreductase [Gaetbulibacter aestuarii]|uniref:FAD-binding oxidoreductase n=1 Tax=Gaetbulibacter aestuarii TaxID=1502358 RepID=A0ABW7N148_9FLAO
MNVDYIIVGIGLAGISFCEQLKAHNKSFLVFDNASQQSSLVAGGLYNPVVLKRFTPVWKSQEQLPLALKQYAELEASLGVKLDYKIPVYRKFASVEEQNDWFTASDKTGLSDYMSTNLIKNKNPHIKAPYGFGEVLKSGRIDVNTLVISYKNHLLKKGLLFEENFSYEALKTEGASLKYKNISAKYIVFAEGFGFKKNPFFGKLPISGTKGELLTINAPELKLNAVIKSGVFLIPVGNDNYIVGATYNWNDKTHEVSEAARKFLLEKLDTLMSCSYKIIDQVAGIRPTVKDRRPLVGEHHLLKSHYILNGLGTRGVMIGPYVAEKLFQCIENKVPLEKEIDCNRFDY